MQTAEETPDTEYEALKLAMTDFTKNKRWPGSIKYSSGFYHGWKACGKFNEEHTSQALTAYRADILSIVHQGGDEEDIMKLDLGKYNL